MAATARDSLDDAVEQPAALSWLAAQEQDAYWRCRFQQERYWRPDHDYEDYAPAYCVGYTGCAQYGGDFADAQHSLCANWERIKCDSRLSLDEAMLAIRAAWDRMARLRERRNTATADESGYDDASLFQAMPAASLAVSQRA